MKKSIEGAARKATSRALGSFLAVLLAALLPTSASAAEGDHITISFDKTQAIGLWLSFAIGILSVLYGLGWVRSKVMAQSPGSEKLQQVGLAIREGALAYLRKQIATMSIFILLLFCGLVGLYWQMGNAIAIGVGICFVCGVTASYVSGYAGMLMAVAGNMRTANAAISSPKTSLETAFRSGAVAGLVTVGIGLTGSSTILLFFPAIATNLLVGFGFGASLAALFMRVGGGIFTKAADVGADLVGKVEAGIPEDDPRNPAVIADNVGDNVGDCAGMAADVFESYEVMLVASIVLGAATSLIFDPHTWPRLVVYGLAVSALGLLASALGIATVRGSDDHTSDPLKALTKGFTLSAVLAFVLVGVLSYTMMGGTGELVRTTELTPVNKIVVDRVKALQDIQTDLAAKTKKEPWQVTAEEVLAAPAAKDLGYDSSKKEDVAEVSAQLQAKVESLPKPADLSGMSPVTDFNDPNNKALQFAIRNQANQPMGGPPAAPMTTIGNLFGPKGPADGMVAIQIQIKEHVPAQPAQGRNPARTEQTIDRKTWVGPIVEKSFDEQIAQAKTQAAAQKIDLQVNKIQSVPTQLYTSPDGRVAVAVDDRVDKPEQLQLQTISPTYFKDSAKVVEDAMKVMDPSKPSPMPPQQNIDLAVAHHTVVPWYLFWFTIGFGILMAFAIQYLTDRYVSTHQGPTQEVAGVAVAGAAPMVIQGFAHALTSSVFMVVAIVVALLFPLVVFNPAKYGGFTLGFYGIALVGLGLLTTTAYILAMDTFGPISDNAQGVFEMSGSAHEHPEAAKSIAQLDAAGNTTKALTKGFAISTAVVAAIALFHSYLAGAHLSAIGLRLDVPEIFLGLLIGGAAPYLFSAFAINAVGRASFDLINEVRRQFREDNGIMAGTSKPDYGRCVSIVTAAAQKELLAPGILAIALPIAVGFGFSIGKAPVEIDGHFYNLTGAQALGGFLAGAIVSGQLMAVLLANSGGMWDNAKKLVEDGLHGGKGTEAHKAAVVCDTIGDPFKDTAGPALNPLIKVMNLVGLLISGIIIQPFGPAVSATVTLVCLAVLVASIVIASKGSMSDALRAVEKEASAADHHFAAAALAEPPVSEPPVATTEPVAEVVEEPKAEPTKRKLFVEDDEA
ncbi:MAG TPA: sodium/proton-translocating pyrophosphatase [Fimbriimonas sp.]|nr:sodium/proton-translocating pyrophosphatase [Fimbriimonas sp.]